MIKTRILITGSTGMVGQNLLEHPLIQNFELLLPRSSELDLREFQNVLKYLKQHTPEIVVHLAGKVGGIQANIQEPVSFLLENLDMGRNIVHATSVAGIKKLLNLGSSCMYPRNHNEPLTEDLILKGELEPTNEGYALAKIITARLCEYEMRQDNSLQFKTIIPCNLYGRFDKFQPSQSHLIPAIIHKIHLAKSNGDSFIEIWGDGKARREFMFAGDFADVLVKAILNFDDIPRLMNVGLGFDFTILEYYSIAAEVMKFDGKFTFNIDKPVGMSRKLVNVEKMKALGWSPRNDLHKSISLTYQYYLENIIK
jgi:GDP-L-fucose synthase